MLLLCSTFQRIVILFNIILAQLIYNGEIDIFKSIVIVHVHTPWSITYIIQIVDCGSPLNECGTHGHMALFGYSNEGGSAKFILQVKNLDYMVASMTSNNIEIMTHFIRQVHYSPTVEKKFSNFSTTIISNITKWCPSILHSEDSEEW